LLPCPPAPGNPPAPPGRDPLGKDPPVGKDPEPGPSPPEKLGRVTPWLFRQASYAANEAEDVLVSEVDFGPDEAFAAPPQAPSSMPRRATAPIPNTTEATRMRTDARGIGTIVDCF